MMKSGTKSSLLLATQYQYILAKRLNFLIMGEIKTMLPNHMEAEQRYDKLRKLAFEYAQEGTSNNLEFRTITPEALNATKLWEKSVSRRVDWDWIDGYSSFKFRYPKRFEVAIWHNNRLISISMGRPTYQGSALRLDFVEAMPRDLGDRPPVFDEVLVAYAIYARMINAKQIRIMHPINDAVKTYYETFGYSYVAKQDYLYKDVL